MSTYSEFFLNSKISVVQVETIQISHPNFTKTYNIVRNVVDGFTTDDVGVFDYYPLRITPMGARNTLDSGIKIELGDLGEVLPLELDAIQAANGFSIKPSVTYRIYRSDDRSAPIFGPLILQIVTFSFNKEGATFEAKAPALNVSKTGEVYTISRFPMLRGFLT